MSNSTSQLLISYYRFFVKTAYWSLKSVLSSTLSGVATTWLTPGGKGAFGVIEASVKGFSPLGLFNHNLSPTVRTLKASFIDMRLGKIASRKF